jgi:hypothetical protein
VNETDKQPLFSWLIVGLSSETFDLQKVKLCSKKILPCKRNSFRKRPLHGAALLPRGLAIKAPITTEPIYPCPIQAHNSRFRPKKIIDLTEQIKDKNKQLAAKLDIQRLLEHNQTDYQSGD